MTIFLKLIFQLINSYNGLYNISFYFLIFLFNNEGNNWIINKRKNTVTLFYTISPKNLVLEKDIIKKV